MFGNFFNLFGTIVWYPLRFMREFPLHASLICGIMVRMWRLVSIIYLALTFVAIPFTAYGIAKLLQNENKGILAYMQVINVIK